MNIKGKNVQSCYNERSVNQRLPATLESRDRSGGDCLFLKVLFISVCSIFCCFLLPLVRLPLCGRTLVQLGASCYSWLKSTPSLKLTQNKMKGICRMLCYMKECSDAKVYCNCVFPGDDWHSSGQGPWWRRGERSHARSEAVPHPHQSTGQAGAR